MKRENNKKFKKRRRNQNRSLTCRVLSMMFAIVLFCSTVLINTDYVSQASSFDDMVDMVEVEEDSAAADTSEDTGDDLDTDVNFESESEEGSAETYSESDDFGSSDADFSSGENMFTDGTSESSAPAEEAAQPVSCIVNLKNETIEVKAEAPAGVLPNGTQMIVKAVENNTEDAELTDQYNKLAAKITEQLQSQSKNLDGFLAYNVSFTDADGNPVEPTGKVNYSFTYKEASSPELTDPAASTVTAAMIRTNKETSELELTELKAEEDKLTVETNESRQLTKAAFQSAATAAFTFVWSSTPAADDNENTENKEENGEVNNEEVNADTNTENTEENGEETNTENNVENSEEEQNPEEAPDQEQIKMIRITADEVNLRVSPSTEADVIATVDTDTQLPLLETVTDEDEFTWYKVSYEEAEAYVRSDMAEVVETEEQDVKVEEQAPAEITRYDYESDEVNVKVTLTNPEDLPDEAELSVTPVEISQEAEEQITQEAIEQKKAIDNIRAYDIKFLLDGEEIQPGETVKVEVSFPEEETTEDADVYHVDENENVENMNGSVNKEGNVEFDTPHFSTYVIVNNKTTGKINVVVEHYKSNTEEKIYADDKRELNAGDKVDCKKATNWNITRVTVNKNDGNGDVEVPEDDILLVQDATVKVYYTPADGTTVGLPVFYDYTVKAVSDSDAEKNNYPSINQDDSYNPTDSRNRITMGNTSDTHNVIAQYTNKYRDGKYKWQQGSYWVNQWTGSANVITGLLAGLNSDGSVNFNCADPGLFDNTNKTVNIDGKDRYLRQVIKDYKIVFNREGDTYTLDHVTNAEGTDVTTQYNQSTGNNFFPLDTIMKDYEYSFNTKAANGATNDDGSKKHNYFFGMRYDIEFELGDYIGDLNYSFTGDDDMWVVLDGGKEGQTGDVVIDLGGIHNAATDEVDLWEKLYNGKYKDKSTRGTEGHKLDDDEKKEKHTLTVLYLERGAGASNCYMNFTLPNATISQVTTDAVGKLSFTKVNKQGTGLSGATFGLYADENCTQQIATSISGDNGITNFEKLRPGEYFLKEVQAPAGYATSSTKWKVEVTAGVEDAVVKNMQGEVITDKEFVNETYNEVIHSSMETSKTAKVKNWDDRTYDITITASSTSTSTTTSSSKPVVDIMLVLDVSGSMDYKLKSYTYKYVGDNSEATREELSTKNTNYYIEVNGSYKKLYYYNNKWYVQVGYWGDDAADNKYAGCKIYNYITTRMEALRDSVKQFIEDTAVNSPNSKIGITVYSSEGYGCNGTSTDLVNVGDNKKTLITFVDELYAYGGTDPKIGLEDAKNKLDAVGATEITSGETERDKYVVLFTDGEPTGGTDEWSTTAQQNAETQARYLREGKRLNAYDQEEKTRPGYTVYTIGFDLSKNATKFLAGDSNNSTKYPGIASPGCAKTANDAASLGTIFQEIQGTITQDLDIHDAIITDVIDPRFELLDEEGKPITLNGEETKEAYGGIVSLVNGKYQIQWTDQTIPNKNRKVEPKKWEKTITVKAKDSFIGGNNITTNVSPDSKITTGYGEVELDQPKVNVKAKMNVGSKEVTIYKGDEMPTNSEILNQLFDKKTVAANAMVDQSKFTIKWYTDAKCTIPAKDENNNDVTDLSQLSNDNKHPTETIKYYIKVTYDAGKPSAESNKNTTIGDKTYIAGEAQGKGENIQYTESVKGGTYTVNVISGEIQITKKLVDESGNPFTEVNPQTFKFKVTKLLDESGTIKKDDDGNPVLDTTFGDASSDGTGKTGSVVVTVTVPKDRSEGILTGNQLKKLQKLPRGIYEVEEVETSADYEVDSADVDSAKTKTDCYYVKEDAQNKKVRFSLGYKLDKNNVVNVIDASYKHTGGGQKGVTTYTNKLVTADLDLKKTDNNETLLTGAKFKLEKKSGENWVSVEKSYDNFVVNNNKGKIELNNLRYGDYRLTEVTAPSGYMLLSSPICFTVSNGTVTLTNAEGTDSNMWTLTTDSTNPPVLTIKNQKLYSLPSTGGSGIYWYMIGGMVLMSTAAWILYKNKCREVLGK